MAGEKLNKRMVKSAVLADLFSITTRRIQQLTKDEILTGEKIGGHYQYELSKSIKDYIAYLNEKNAGKENPEIETLETKKLSAECEYKEAKAKMAQYELQELEGKLHQSEDVEFMLEDLASNIKQLLLAVPPRLCKEVTATKDSRKVLKILNDEMNAVLTQLSNYSYDENFFKDRARNRKGWEQLEDE